MSLSKRKRAAVRALAEPHQHAVLARAMERLRNMLPLLTRVETAMARRMPSWTEVGADGERRWKPHAYHDANAFAGAVAAQVEKRLAAELDHAMAEAERMGAEHAEEDFTALSAMFFAGAG